MHESTTMDEVLNAADETTPKPIDKYLVIANVSKINNVVQLIHTAFAYDFYPILVAAPKIYESVNYLLHVDRPILYFSSLEECKEMLQREAIPLVGIEILEHAQSINTYSFPHRIAIMPGNEGSGMSSRQVKSCDALVYIPHYGHGTASLNVHVATTMVMNQYHIFQQQQSISHEHNITCLDKL